MQKQEWFPFTQINNSLLKDNRLSAKAKWIYCYIYSKPDNRDFSCNRIAEEFQDWLKSILSGMKELEVSWWIKRIKKNDWRLQHTIMRDNSLQMPESQKGLLAKKPEVQKGLLGTVYNKEKYIINNINNSKTNKDSFGEKSFFDLQAISPTEMKTKEQIQELWLEIEKEMLLKFIRSWNNSWAMKSCKKITKEIESERHKIFKSWKWDSKELREGFKNYIYDCKNRTEETHWTYSSHRFTFYEFIKQANWYKRFANM